MMMNENAQQDLTRYKNITLWSSLILVSGLLALLGLAYVLDWVVVIHPLWGALLGTLCASVNIFALAYAFYALAIQNKPRRVVLWPIATFILMCILSFFLATGYDDYILGFALGLTAPLLFGAAIIFL